MYLLFKKNILIFILLSILNALKLYPIENDKKNNGKYVVVAIFLSFSWCGCLESRLTFLETCID